MTEKKSPLDQALDLFVYAPLGLALVARDELPRLVERGRTQVQAQTTMARMVGQFAVAQGQKEAEKVVRRFTGAENGHAPPPRAAAASAPARAKPVPDNGAVRPSADTLAIPGYDSLAASQVVPRLAGLATEELEAVRRYEAATRNRRTILARIQQLQSAD
ncbi:MAG TPA: hypothetical protein VHF47_12915 [Acidimicrobiales bacterium]|nr:hypothetical protein [Acidimicrobiales bacterium]